jgi:hypothetical protein
MRSITMLCHLKRSEKGEGEGQRGVGQGDLQGIGRNIVTHMIDSREGT